MTKSLEIALPADLLDFVEQRATYLNRRRDDIIAEAIRHLHAEWELEQGYIEEKEDALEFAEQSLPLFNEVMDEASTAR
jgi:predicted transcriptional regulator